MKKKLAALLCGVVCACLLAAPVYAADGSHLQDDPDITITGGEIGGSEVIVAGADTEPVSTTVETIEGVPFITKVYELPQGADISAYTAPFEQDGCLYTKYDVSQRVRDGQTDTKTVTQTGMLETESDKISDITVQAAPMVLYNQDGYTGQLSLDVAAIVVEGSGTTTYSYRVEDVREYTNLDRNDAAYVPKTVLKNGITLQLENIEWVVMGQHSVDGRMVPTLFKAIATYAGTATGSRVEGYTAILTYTGDVTHTTPGKTLLTVVFRGEPVAVSEAAPEASEPATSEGNGKNGFGMVAMLAIVILLSAACLAVAGVRIYQRIRDRCGDGNGEDYTGDDFSDYEGFAPEEPGPAPNVQEDTHPFKPQVPEQSLFQTYDQDEFNIDDLFDEEGFFND